MVARQNFLTLIATAAAFYGWTSAKAAAPEIIVFTGGHLEKPVHTTGYNDNHEFILALATSNRRSGARRSGSDTLEVYMYWGFQWRACARDLRCLESLAAEKANERGRLYLTSGAQTAIYVPLHPRGRSGVILVSAAGFSWLEKQGIASWKVGAR